MFKYLTIILMMLFLIACETPTTTPTNPIPVDPVLVDPNQPLNLMVETSGDSSGKITGALYSTNDFDSYLTDVIDCGTDCSEKVLPNKYLRLTAFDPIPFDGFTFASWAGVVCDGGRQTNLDCAFTITKETNVTANYDLAKTIDITIVGINGQVSSNNSDMDFVDDGIKCEDNIGDCRGYVRQGDQVTLYTWPTSSFSNSNIVFDINQDSGSVFEKWSGITCLEGTELRTCKFIVVDNEKITASFTKAPKFTLMIDEPSEQETVISIVDQVNFEDCYYSVTPCSAYYPKNHSITLSVDTGPFASPFLNWQGVVCQEGNTSTLCTFNIIADTVVTAKLQ